MKQSEESIFHEAFEITNPSEQADFLNHACSDDAQLRQRVELLLSAFPSGDPLEPTIVHDRASNMPEFGEKVGDQIGNYKLLEQIGEGGMVKQVWGTRFLLDWMRSPIGILTKRRKDPHSKKNLANLILNQRITPLFFCAIINLLTRMPTLEICRISIQSTKLNYCVGQQTGMATPWVNCWKVIEHVWNEWFSCGLTSGFKVESIRPMFYKRLISRPLNG